MLGLHQCNGTMHAAHRSTGGWTKLHSHKAALAPSHTTASHMVRRVAKVRSGPADSAVSSSISGSSTPVAPAQPDLTAQVAAMAQRLEWLEAELRTLRRTASNHTASTNHIPSTSGSDASSSNSGSTDTSSSDASGSKNSSSSSGGPSTTSITTAAPTPSSSSDRSNGSTIASASDIPSGRPSVSPDGSVATTGRGSYKGMTLSDFQALPDKIYLIRHAQSKGNLDSATYSETPDYEVPLSSKGWEQAVACGLKIRDMLEAEYGDQYKLFFMCSPYCRTRQTFVAIRQAFDDRHFAGLQEEVQLREQDFGNMQQPDKIKQDIAERNRFGRFYFRFPNGESSSDVYNRISIFEDHLVRDMKSGRFGNSTNLVLITHGLTLRVFLMRWFAWSVESFLQVYNPPNAEPIVIEKISEAEFMAAAQKLDKRQSLQVKQAYRLRKGALSIGGQPVTPPLESMDLTQQTYNQ